MQAMTLDSVKPARKIRPPRILLLGTQKVGKSSFACDANSPVAIPVIREEGIDDLNVDAFPVSKTFMDVMAAMHALCGEHDHKTMILDSLSTFSPLVSNHAMEKEGVDTEAKLGGGYGRQYDTPLQLLAQFMDLCDQLRNRGMACILIGHVTAKRFDDPIAGSYTRYDLDMPSKLAESIYRWVDVILFANWSSYVVGEDVGFDKEAKRGIGSGERKLYTQQRPSHPGGGRGVYGRLPYEMPLEWNVFQEEVRKQLELEQGVTNG